MVTSTAHSYKTELKDRTLWFDGDSTVPEDEVSRLIAVGTPVDGLFVEQLSDNIKQFNTFVPKDQQIGVKTSVRDLDFSWNIPEGYLTLDVERYIADKLKDELYRLRAFKTNDYTTPRIVRIQEELELYKKLGLFNVLQVLIYIINTLHANNVVWGVGRGSSVSSYVLYLIGVHDVDSIEYELDINDFLHLE